MNLKLFQRIVFLILAVFIFVACNDTDNENVIIQPSSDGQIKTFSADAYPINKIDSIAYPILRSTYFFVLNQSGRHEIFNKDSLHHQTDIRSLKLKLTFSTPPSRVDLVYLDSLRMDSVAQWNTADSVKFIFDKPSHMYYPKLKVIAPDGRTERLYTVSFNIHKVNPDSVTWEQIKINNKIFSLPAKGESKVITNADKSKFYALIKQSNGVYVYSSSVKQPIWSAGNKTNLPQDVIVQSFNYSRDKLVILSSQGDAYVSTTANEGKEWTKNTLANNAKYKSIVGLLPEIETKNAQSEFLVTYVDQSNKLLFGKTATFTSVEAIKIKSQPESSVMSGFPLSNSSSITREIDNDKYLMVTGGLDRDKKVVNKSWIVRNISLASRDKLAELAIAPTYVDNLLPYKSGVTTFVYGNEVQAISGDSLSLYSSSYGEKWRKELPSSKLNVAMKDMNRPSVVVDNDNFMWIFGGVSSKDGNVFSDQIWKGRLNRMISKKN